MGATVLWMGGRGMGGATICPCWYHGCVGSTHLLFLLIKNIVADNYDTVSCLANLYFSPYPLAL